MNQQRSYDEKLFYDQSLDYIVHLQWQIQDFPYENVHVKKGINPIFYQNFPEIREKMLWGHALSMITRNYPSFCFEIISRNGLSITGFYGSFATLSLVNGFRCVMEYMYCGFSE